MKYQIEFKPTALKSLEKIQKSDRIRIGQAIADLRSNPFPTGSIKLRNSAFYRIRCGDYRVIYDVQEQKLVIMILRVGHRRNVYLNQ